jgi:hypothetical protein
LNFSDHHQPTTSRGEGETDTVNITTNLKLQSKKAETVDITMVQT